MTGPADGVAAVILAGGRSSRFGADKLAVHIDGRSILRRSVDAASAVADQVVIVAGTAGDLPPDVAATDPVRVVRDPSPFEGPLAAVRVGLAAVDAELVLVVGGDMPDLVPAVLARLVATLRDATLRDALPTAGVDAVVLEAGGMRRPLPIAVRREPATAAAIRLLDDGERRLRAWRDALQPAILADAVWMADDPDGRTLRDIDAPGDLPGRG